MYLLVATIKAIGYILYGLATVAVWVLTATVIVLAVGIRSIMAFFQWLWERHGKG